MSNISTKTSTTRIGDLSYYRTINKEQNFDILFIHGLGANKE